MEAPAQRRPPIALARSAPRTRSARRPWRRVAATVGAPVVNTPDLQRIVRPITGNRYLGVFAACGGAGSTTLTVLMGSILASCRPDRVVAAEATSTPHALADRAGVEVARSIRDLLADEQRIYGCSELSRFVGRTISRLDVAHLVPGESSLSADEYRRAVAVLARFYDIVLSDVGASGATPAAEPVLGLADLAVVVTSPTQHGWRCAHRLITQLCEGPSAIEPQRIVTVINGVHRRNPVETDRMIVSLRAMCAGGVDHLLGPASGFRRCGQPGRIAPVHADRRVQPCRLDRRWAWWRPAGRGRFLRADRESANNRGGGAVGCVAFRA